MNNSKFNQIFHIGSVIAVATQLLAGTPGISHAETTQQRQTSTASIQLDFTPPNRGRVPGNGTNNPTVTASRSLGSLHAILPWSEVGGIRQQPIHQGYTYVSHPAFWISFDTETDGGTPVSIDIEVKDRKTDGEIYFYQSRTSLILDRGVFRIQLPAEAPPLQVGSTYQWRFRATRDEDKERLGESFGDVERLELPSDAAERLAEAELEERAVLYGELGVSHELVDTLARLRCENPSNPRFENVWLNLLRENNSRIGALIRTEAAANRLLSCGNF